MRLVVAPLLLVVALAGLASGQTSATVEGRITKVGDQTWLRGDQGTFRLEGAWVHELGLLDGGTVRLVGTTTGPVFTVRRVAAPQRKELSGKVEAAPSGGLRLVTDGGPTVRLGGNTGLLRAGERVLIDTWFPQGGKALVISVESQTTGRWTLLRNTPTRLYLPTSYVRGKGRSVWLLKREGDYSFVRWGGSYGWVSNDEVEAAPPPPAPADSGSLVDRLQPSY